MTDPTAAPNPEPATHDDMVDLLQQSLDQRLAEHATEKAAAAKHPRRRSPPEKAAAPKPAGSPLTSLTPPDVDAKLLQETLDARLRAVEVGPFARGDPAQVESDQAVALQQFKAGFKIADAPTAEWATRVLAQAEDQVEGLLAAFEDVQAEWARRIRAARRDLEIRQGLLTDELRAFAEKALTGKKKSVVVGVRKLAFRDEPESVVLGDREALVRRVLAEDPLGAEGRLAVEYKVADLAAEKARALEEIHRTGSVPAGFEHRPARREFHVQKPRLSAAKPGQPEEEGA